jgi:hypothetical protein
MCNKCGKAATEHIQTLEEIRDMLLKETPKQGESADKRSGFVNGILDMYNLMKNRQDKLLALK